MSAALRRLDPAERPAVAAAPAVSVRGVSMVFGTERAVDGASFDVRQGSFLTILGPSGSGKTTLLRMIAGFQEPSEGEIVVGGVPVASLPAYRRSIGMVFQRLALFPHMTVEENVAFPLKMRRFDARDIPSRVARYLDLVKLGGLAKRRIHELSGGQQQRVAIARALVFEPDLLLLDEPLAALDRKLREEMQLEFRRIQRELGVTTINVTHDQREALVVSDEIIVMDRGRIQQMAAPMATYRRPANAFVAGFIGVTNFLEGTVTAVSGGDIEFRAGPLVLVGQSMDAAPPVGSPVRAAIRAEHIRVAGGQAALGPARTVLAGTVRDVIFEGERLVYEVAPEGLDGAVLRVFDQGAEERPPFAPGAPVLLGWSPRDLLVFTE